MKNKIYLAIRYQFRRKSNIFIALIIGIVMFINIMLGTYNISAINYMNSDDSYYYRLLSIFIDMENSNKNLNDIRKDLENINHVNNVSLFITHRTMLHSNELENNNMDGTIELFSANNNTLPEIVKGTDFPDNEGNYIICPENFYPTSNLEDLKYMSKRDKFNIEDYLNKNITFEYKSNFETNEYTIDFKLIGLYKNSLYDNDESVCYTLEKSISEIITNEYSDDIDIENNVNNLEYQNDFVIEIDDVTNKKLVEEELIDLGYYYESMISVVPEYFENITNKTNMITIIVSILLLIFIVIVLQKKFNDELDQYRLKICLGYKKKDIKFIYIFSNVFSLIIACIIAFLITLILMLAFKLVIYEYPFIFNKWQIVTNYYPVLIVLLAALIATIISSIINTSKLFGEIDA